MCFRKTLKNVRKITNLSLPARPRSPQDRPKRAPSPAKMAQDRSNSAQDRPKKPQCHPKRVAKSSQECLPQETPRGFQEARSCSQVLEARERPQEDPKGTPRGATTAPEMPQVAIQKHQDAQLVRKEPKEHIQESNERIR